MDETNNGGGAGGGNPFGGGSGGNPFGGGGAYGGNPFAGFDGGGAFGGGASGGDSEGSYDFSAFDQMSGGDLNELIARSPFGVLLNLPGIDGPEDILAMSAGSAAAIPFGGGSGSGNPFEGIGQVRTRSPGSLAAAPRRTWAVVPAVVMPVVVTLAAGPGR